MEHPLISIVIATFNSAHTLHKTLDSIRQQTYPASQIEILVIDGGSSDNTLNIAKTYSCRIIGNPKTVPAWAKYVGYMRARGRYIMYLDSDEVMENRQSIERKINVFLTHSRVHAVTGSGYKSPKGFSVLNDYINEFGDPFSFFFYRLSKDDRFFITMMSKKYRKVKENSDFIVFEFSQRTNLPIFELVAMGSVVDLAYCKKNFPVILNNPGLIPHMFNLLVSKRSHIAIVKRDPLVHYSSDAMGKYLRKITSRIVNNIFTPAKEGFAGRNEFARREQQYKKYLFLPYSFSVVFPLVDSLLLVVSRKNIRYLVHVPLCLYTASLIVYYACLKSLGIRPMLKSYGQAKFTAQ